MEPVVLAFDPFHPYVSAFIQACHQQWGLRTVCLYTDPDERRHSAGTQPLVRSDLVAAHYAVDLSQPVELARQLAARHEIRGVIPHHEPYVVPAAIMAQSLGLEWVDPATMALFRDKAALKDRIRACGSPRVNASTIVTGPAEVRAAIETGSYGRFVLKPNSGMGNSAIGFFEAGTAGESLADYFRDHPAGAVIMEEFLEGREYCVNGQVDAVGEVHTLSVLRTRHVSANGRAQLASSFEFVAHGDSLFGTLSEYAARVLSAVGLVRSPFHMEVMVDDRGPCLIEVAARMAGAGQARSTTVAHAGALDTFVLAASGYTGLAPTSAQHPDWTAYDSRTLRTIVGVSSDEQRIVRLRGADQIRAMPGFVEWEFQPRVGQKVHRTIDLETAPWLVTMAAGGTSELDEVERHVREAIAWNDSVPIRERVASGVALVRERAKTRGAALREMVDVRPRRIHSGASASVAGFGGPE